MSLFKKPSRKFRQRVVATESDEEKDEDKYVTNNASSDSAKQPTKLGLSSSGALGATAEIAVKNKFSFAEDETDNKESSRKVSNLLSFHDEEEDTEVFKIKKSNYSRRLAKQRSKERKKVDPNNVQEKINTDELKEKNGKLAPKRVPNEPTIIVKPLSIPNNNHAKPIVLNGEEAESAKFGSEDEEDDDSGVHRFNPMKSALSSGVIPDAATIYAVKKHRQMAREQGDFIPLDDTDKMDKNESRLVRDDDNDRSDDEEPSRINFTVNVAEIERQKAREAFLSAETLREETEEAAELEAWEKEQIRKGVGVTVTQQVTFMEDCVPIPNYETVQHARQKASMPPAKKDKSNLSTQSIKERLKEQLNSLEQVHRARERELESYRYELDSTLSNIESLEKEAPRLGQRFTFYQELRAYVEDLIDCLDIKYPKVSQLEEQMVLLLQQRSERIVSRRQQDIKDQAEDYSMLANRIMRGLPVEFDEKPLSDEGKLRRSAEREGRRMRRRKKRETTLGGLQHQDGLSTDDEEGEAELQQFRISRENISNDAKIVFEDVVEEFGSLEGIRAKFEKWRCQENGTYKDAYIPLCLPKVFSAFVRLNLLTWNPLEDKKCELESLTWYKSLATYGWNRTYITTDDLKSDPDLNLLPNIVERVVLPKITMLVEFVWDPLSTRQTLQLIKQLTKILQDYPSINANCKRLQILLKAVVTRFQKSLENDIFVPIYPKQLVESGTSNAAVFFQRQFWTCVKLLRNILTWHSLLADEPLQELALGCLLNRYIVLTLQCFSPSIPLIEKCKTIVSTFPRAWFGSSTGNTTSIPQLDMFQRFLVQLVPRCKGTNDCDLSTCAKEVAHMLARIGALEKAAAITKEYNVELKSTSKT